MELSHVGKTTLFNCLSKAEAQLANNPFSTIEPKVGTIESDIFYLNPQAIYSLCDIELFLENYFSIYQALITFQYYEEGLIGLVF